jgi:hypothetical protein
MSRAKTPRAPGVRPSPALFFALFASWREDRSWLRLKAALGTLSLCGEHLCRTNPILPLGWGPREQNVQNEPNARSGAPRRCLRLRIADSERPAPRRQSLRGREYKQTQLAGANRAKQSQFPPGGTRPGDRGSPLAPQVWRSIAPNKANSGGWDAARPSSRPGALTMPPGTGASVRHRLDAPLRETKPIPRSPIVDCRASLAMTCRGLGTSLLRGQPAFGGVRFRADEGCETKPIPASRDAARGSGFPSHPSALPVNCAKQTQFRQREEKRQVLCGKGVMVNRTSHRPQQNKANSRLRRAGRGRWGGDRGAIVRRHLDAPLQETKPIPRGRAEAMEAESATVGRPHPSPATSNLKLDTSNFKPDTLAI